MNKEASADNKELELHIELDEIMKSLDTSYLYLTRDKQKDCLMDLHDKVAELIIIKDT